MNTQGSDNGLVNGSDGKMPKGSPLTSQPFNNATLDTGIISTLPNAGTLLSAAPTPKTLLIALRRRWLLAVVLATLCAAVGSVATWFALPVTWRARTLLHISANRPFILFETPEARIDFGAYQRSQIALVKSRLVLNAALADPEVTTCGIVLEKTNPVDWLESQIRVDFSVGPEILSISMDGDDPVALKHIVIAVRNAYVKEIVNKEQNLRMRRLDQLQKLYTRYDDILRDKRVKLKELAQTLGAKKSEGLKLKQQFYYSHLESLERELLQLQSQTRKFHIEHQSLEVKHKAIDQSILPADRVDERLKVHPEIAKLQGLITARQARIASFKERLQAPENDRQFIEENQALAANLKDLESRRNDLRPVINQQLREEMLAQTTSAILSQKEQVALLGTLEKSLEEQVNKKMLDIDSLSKGTINMEWLDEEIVHISETHKRIGNQKEALQVEIDAPSRVSVLEEAFATQTRGEASRQRTMGLAGAGLFGLVIFGVALVEFHARRVSGVHDVATGLGLPLLGVLPQVRSGGAFGMSMTNYAKNRSQDLLMDSINAMRTMLVYAAKQKALRTVMVTSALKGEGKTLVSSHLAVSMVRAGFRTLLIDADLRRPSVHRLFDLSADAGLSELLRGELELDAILRPGPVPGLTVITAGRWDQSLVHLLAQDRLGVILDQVKTMYDFVIIDSAPVLGATDSLLIGQHADGVLLAVLCDVSRLPTIHAAYERLAMLGVRVLGAVVGGASVESYAYPTLSPTA